MHVCFFHCSVHAEENSPGLERRAVNGDLSVLTRNKSPFYSSFHKTLSSRPHGQDGRCAPFNRPTAQCDQCWMSRAVSPAQGITEGITQPHPNRPDWWRYLEATRLKPDVLLTEAEPAAIASHCKLYLSTITETLRATTVKVFPQGSTHPELFSCTNVLKEFHWTVSWSCW